jgi:hypothetical protein
MCSLYYKVSVTIILYNIQINYLVYSHNPMICMYASSETCSTDNAMLVRTKFLTLESLLLGTINYNYNITFCMIYNIMEYYTLPFIT